MSTFFAIIAFVFVFAVLVVVLYALFELGPFARHVDQFRDLRTGKRKWGSPHLD